MTQIARNRPAALSRREANVNRGFGGGVATGNGSGVRVESTADGSLERSARPRATAAAVVARQHAVQRRLQQRQAAALERLESEAPPGSALREPEEDVEAAFNLLPQVVGSAIQASCNRSMMNMPLAESLRTGCLSCGDPYIAGESLVVTPCIHTLHARCFYAWAASNYESRDICEVWRLQCPQCRQQLE